MSKSIFFQKNDNFELFGTQHLIAFVFFALIGFLLIRWARKLSKEKQYRIGNGIAFSLSAAIILWTILKVYDSGFNVSEDLPFHLCNIVSLFLPVFSLTRKKVIYEVLFFWILAGTSQAVITPDLRDGFPHYEFLKYWYVHMGLIIFILYATFVYKMRPTVKSIFKSFLALQVYFVLMLIVNKLLDSNYLFISRKPEGASLLDYLGDWPYYIFVAELIIFPYFFLIYLPFYLTRKRVSK